LFHNGLTSNKVKNMTYSYNAVYNQVWANAEKDFREMDIDSNRFLDAPYTITKAKLYALSAAVIVKCVQNVGTITPNLITLIYALSGFLSLAFFLQDSFILKISALFYFFLIKGALDWSDGALARLRGLTSELGRILDIWGAHVNNIAFYILLYFHVYQYEQQGWILYLLVCLLTLKSVDINDQVFKYYSLANIGPTTTTTPNRIYKSKTLMLEIIKWPISDRARTLDVYLLVILFEMLVSNNSILTSYIIFFIPALTMVRLLYNFKAIRIL